MVAARLLVNGVRFWQPMYRSSGVSSGMPGEWFPFAGVIPGWIIKSHFTVDNGKVVVVRNPKGDRYGPYKWLSERMRTRKFKHYKFINPIEQLERYLNGYTLEEILAVRRP